MKRWVTREYGADWQKISARYHISPVTARVLVGRGLFNFSAMDRFLFPEKEDMYPLDRMAGAMDAVLLLEEKIKQNKKICVIGDYDVDGVVSAYIFCHGLELFGAGVIARIPHRVRDGYGMREYMAAEAKNLGCDTILTCDNGVSALPAIQKAKALGMTVIVTDHHEVPKENGREILPPADVIVDPKQSACSYPFSALCGAGIAYKMMQVLFARAGRTDCDAQFLSFAALATVCDVVPLTDENRILVKQGLTQFTQTKNVGLLALISACQFDRKINARDLGFRIGPCINAAGRLSDATLALSLFLETDKDLAQKKAQELVDLNEERKAKTEKATNQAVLAIEQNHLLEQTVLVVFVEECEESVAGIVAGRIREKYYRPTLIITRSNDVLKGSARSIPEYHMQKALNACRELLIEYGGHAMAAGFSLLPENLPLLERQLNENCTLTQKDLTEKIQVDCVISLADMTEAVVGQLDSLEPFGEKNERPVFAAQGIHVCFLKLCGPDNRIARLKLTQEGDTHVYSAVDFACELHLGEAIRSRYGEKTWENMREGICSAEKVEMLIQPKINERYGGVEFQIVDCR